MFKLQNSPPVLGAEKNAVLRKLVRACSLQGRADTSAGDQQHPASAGRLVCSPSFTGRMRRFGQYQVYPGLPLK